MASGIQIMSVESGRFCLETAFGANMITVAPGQRGTGGVMSGTQQNLTLDDALAIIHQVPNIQQGSPSVGGSFCDAVLGYEI